MSDSYPRDMQGYGETTPQNTWPNGAKIAVQFVVNYEEGGENNILHGDAASEAFLSEIVGAAAWPGQRHMNMESIYEYGARAGFWRLRRLFDSFEVPVTVYGVATALERSPDVTKAMISSGWEIASHGLKWIEYKDFDKSAEREHMDQATALHTKLTGSHPLGWYTGRSSINTLDLVRENGGFLYASDSYADDLPYWVDDKHLIVPYTLDANDMRFATPQGFNSGDQFYTYLKDTFDELYAEGNAGAPKMMSIGLHCRLAGRPGRTAAIRRFLEYIASHENVWTCRRQDIAKHWLTHHAPKSLTPSRMSAVQFSQAFGEVYEHSPWIVEQARIAGLSKTEDTSDGLLAAFTKVVDLAPRDKILALINAHPDLAGKLAQAKQLTQDSTAEQKSAGLDHLSQDEVSRFTELNEAYKSRFGFPFIFAVKGRTKAEVLSAFETRLNHTEDQEFTTAVTQINKIAAFRLADLLPAKDPS